ncbi:spore maturation protein [Petroclostridium sp. X23]|jgi:spore maturation protein B|uniref:spore maturation protein n=1 Tax=Petroclostridium sp. X23 TaxID=3045146 RepID=UPI0024AE7C64|nr:spore maturation protein [Petroclostridium sp. X23]WHH57061.1 spore maturation protein [Petroclostridium sp. X23]
MELLKLVSTLAIPLMVFVILSYGLSKDVKVYDCFIEGAKEGIDTIIRILPPLVGLLVAVGIFRASGALELIIHGLKPIISVVRIPPEVVPLALMRPISGSAALAIVTDLIKTYGPDSFIGRVTSTMMGSTETTFYTIAIYFGSIGIKNVRHTIAAALLADLTGIIVSVWICGFVFGWGL